MSEAPAANIDEALGKFKLLKTFCIQKTLSKK